MLRATYRKYTLHFKQPAGTSRGILRKKTSWFIRVAGSDNPGIYGYGECGPLPGLSPDDLTDFETILSYICKNFGSEEDIKTIPAKYPSIRFGLGTALTDLHTGGKGILFPSDFTSGEDHITINGLIWMGDKAFMQKQIIRKLEEGYRVIKMKIGAIDFNRELELLKFIRTDFAKENIEIRLDANGAFLPAKAPEKLKRLSEFDIHSIEQPVRAGQWQTIAQICAKSPIPVALDEELIGPWDDTKKAALLDTIRPQYLILKPTLLGGFRECMTWITLAQERQTGWWITSALESNVGLNALAQWTYTLHNPLPQGLGTGMLYTNNFKSPLHTGAGRLYFDPYRNMNISSLWQIK